MTIHPYDNPPLGVDGIAHVLWSQVDECSRSRPYSATTGEGEAVAYAISIAPSLQEWLKCQVLRVGSNIAGK